VDRKAINTVLKLKLQTVLSPPPLPLLPLPLLLLLLLLFLLPLPQSWEPVVKQMALSGKPLIRPSMELTEREKRWPDAEQTCISRYMIVGYALLG